MDKRIAMIFPNSAVAIKTAEILKEMKLEYPIYEATMDDALKIARTLIGEGTKVLISRGGTAWYLRKRIDIPLIDIKYSYFDFVYSVKKALEYSDKIAIMGFSDAFDAARKVRDALGENLTIIHLKTEAEIESKIQAMHNKGIKVLIGGTPVANIGQKYGMHTIMTGVDEDLIKDAIKEAKHSLKIQLEREEKFETINSILNCASEGIIGTDQNGNITNINNIAKEILGIGDAKIAGRKITDILPFSKLMETAHTGKKLFGELFDIGQTAVAVNSLPIIVENKIIGAVVTIQQVKNIQILEQKIRNKLHAKGHVAKKSFEDIIGKSAAITIAKEKAKKYATVDSTVLILGETGTGKELFAQSIHNHSQRRHNAFVAINCAALPQSILESELFGYVKGAFTGASNEGKAGVFEIAHTGTIFLDEISEISPEVQARLLRVIQEKEITRIGDDKVITVDVRILAASNKDLVAEIGKGKFREDLYYRLAVLVLELPPLRERKEDIFELVHYLIAEKSRKFAKPIREISRGAVAILAALEWPGNIRQLSNIIERVIVICDNGVIDENVIYEATNSSPQITIQRDLNEPGIAGDRKAGILSQHETELIIQVLRDTRGNKTEAARQLGISTTTLWRKIKQLQKGQADILNR